MGQTLTNGIYLPAEGERNCYEGLAANWTALDSLIGGYNVHISNTAIHVTAEDKAAWNGKADASALTAHTGDTTIHVTAEDKAKWDAVTSKADASALTAHTGDTTIHVTAEDKQAWDGHVADSVKHVTAEDKNKWDAVTSKANDNDVVHKSGSEAVSGIKTFTDSIQLKSNVAEYGVTSGNIQFYLMDKNGVGLSKINQGVYNGGVSYITLELFSRDSNNRTVANSITYQYSASLNKTYLLPTDIKVDLGSTGYRWGKIYGIQYYYGSNNVEFSDKFVTTDTTQTISGSKTFEGVDLKLKSVAGEYTVSSGNTSLLFYDKNSLLLSQYKLGVYGSGIPYQVFNIVGYDSNNQRVSKSITFSSSYLDLPTAFLKPDTDNAIALGRSGAKWSDVQTYKINALEPSSLSLPNLSAGVDISGYITNLNKGVNTYTPPANGWINIRIRKTSLIHTSLMIYQTDGLLSSCETDDYNISGTNLPVIANRNVEIYIYADALVEAKFYPCQGNL